MAFSADDFLSESINKRKDQNTFRELKNTKNLVDFCSNDYLGFSVSDELSNNINQEFNAYTNTNNGASGSRLLSGNSEYAEQLEIKLANFHNAEKGLIFNSGYDANIGLFSSVIRKKHTIIYDELVHASIHDGIRLSKAKGIAFKHNNIEDLALQLKSAEGIIYVAIESIYSMDGESANLKEIADLCAQYNANLIVDEAHATGITLNGGKGIVQELNLEDKVFARVHTFGKALGCHGAIVLGSDLLRNFLINYSRSFIYTTALPIKNLMAINQAYDLLKKSDALINNLHALIAYFKSKVIDSKNYVYLNNNSPIQSLIISGNAEVKKVANKIQEAGFDVRPIVSPTVAKGAERLRICIHAHNSKQQIDELCNIINQ